jgi:hypothetical protein
MFILKIDTTARLAARSESGKDLTRSMIVPQSQALSNAWGILIGHIRKLLQLHDTLSPVLRRVALVFLPKKLAQSGLKSLVLSDNLIRCWALKFAQKF